MKHLTVFGLLLASIVCHAQDFYANGLAFNISGANTVEVVYYNNMSNYTHVTVPAQVEFNGVKFDVTAIGDKAFWACRELTYISLPNTITYIGGEAFAGCTGLSSLVFPNSLKKIGDYAFTESGLNSVDIPPSVYEIGERCFYNCERLVQIMHYVTLERIGARAFHRTPWYDAKPNGLVFAGNSVLYSFKGPAPSASFWLGYGSNYGSLSEVTGISGEAFAGDEGDPITTLTSLNAPSVRYVGDRAFAGCSGLEAIYLANLEHAGENAFDGTAWLENAYNGNGVIYLGQVALGMAGWNPSSTLSLRDGTISVADNAFIGLEITNLVLPSSLREIGNASFALNDIYELRIPNSVTSIGISAFEGCSKLKRVYMGSGVQRIGRNAFAGCEGDNTRLSEVHITDLAAWCNIEFDFYKYPHTVKAPRKSAESPRRAGYAVNMYANPLFTAGHLYFNRQELTNINIAVERVSNYAFTGCIGLQNVVLRLHKAGTTIGMGAFRGCGLQSVTLPSSVTAVGRNAFDGCMALTNVYAKMINPTPILENSFPDYNATLHVRQICRDSYSTAPVWSKFSPIKGDIIVDSDFPDLNGDNKVDVGDVNTVLTAILNGNHSATYDINGDGNVNVGDVNAVLDVIHKLR